MQEAVDSPLDFIDEQLQCFDQHMRCPICKELYDTPMILATCSHSFCARCIRRSLSQEQVCPQCRISCHDSNLHNNYDLESVVTQWKTTVRSRILQMHASALAAPPPPMHTSSQSSTRDRTMALQQTTEASHVHTQQTRGRSSKTIVIDDDNGDDDFMDMRTWPSAATFSTPTRRFTRTKNEIDPNMSACPVCQQKMHVDVIERHVNRCLEGDSTIPPMPTKSSVLGPGAPKNLGKKPKKIAHDMYKEKDLKMLLKVSRHAHARH
ncbi:hypothetical protein BC940DRAFT_310216 [Gongronella butleri]|nr:hypothetical protein BC940DRAFT_310216 [Gongronella butleri]